MDARVASGENLHVPTIDIYWIAWLLYVSRPVGKHVSARVRQIVCVCVFVRVCVNVNVRV